MQCYIPNWTVDSFEKGRFVQVCLGSEIYRFHKVSYVGKQNITSRYCDRSLLSAKCLGGAATNNGVLSLIAPSDSLTGVCLCPHLNVTLRFQHFPYYCQENIHKDK